MALTIGELVALIRADDSGFRRGVQGARRELDGLWRDANGRLRDAQGRFATAGEESGRGWGSRLGRAAGTALAAGLRGVVGTARTAGTALLSAALPLAAVATTAAAAAPLLAPVGAELLAVGKAALSAGPALLALGVAAKISKFALTEIFKEGSAARQALSPLADAFTKAGEAGSQAAARGIRPLANELRKAAFPIVEKFMIGVGKAANTVQREFLGWAKSAPGLATLKGILDPISASMQALAPKVSKVAIEFVAMLGRIMGISTAAGTSGLGRVLDMVAEKLRGITAASVQGGLDKLASTFNTIRNVVSTVAGWLGTLVDAYRTYNTEFRLIADAVSILAIAFGGPVVAAIGAAGLIIRHFDQVKAAWESLKAAFAGGGGSGPLGSFINNLRTAANEVLPSLKGAFEQIKAAVLPVLQEIGGKIVNELVPAIGELVAALAPVVSWLIDKLGPVVANTFKNILNVVSGAISIITGVIKVFTAILTGDWGKAWEGIKQILSGAWQIIKAVVSQAINIIKGTISIGLDVIKAVFTRVWNSIKSLVSTVWNGIKSLISGAIGAVKNTITRHINTIKSGWSQGWNAIKSAAANAMNSLRNAISNGVSRVVSIVRGIPGKIRSALGNLGSLLVAAGRSVIQGLIDGISTMLGKLKGMLNKVTGLIPDWKGPMSKDKRLLYKTGQAIMGGLISGMTGTVDKIKSTAGQITEQIRKAFAGRRTTIDDRLIASLRRSTAQLTTLATQRDKIAAQLKEAHDFAAGTASNAQQFAGLASLRATTAAGIRTGLQGRLTTLRKFATDIRTLAARGLSKGLLRQLLEAGPEAGGQLAAALAAADGDTLGAIQAAQREIDAVSDHLGQVGADVLYDSGRGAARGFLAGLIDQQRAIEAQMSKIAYGFAGQVARALGGKAPRPPATRDDRATARAAVHIENYHEAPRGSARATAEELLFLATARG
ncbi:phage tail protein [Thermomonospora cellulosilytica]|uniref:Phage-related protein n=1 Tax=Thermomonospora cellulosilytica TaxID=1411118 RepID=A0A7W3MXJ2_9ACTN|nr:hypothetical protein [Thermomonospora cellulosilytica]MBA9003730.1 phage-related protein [Thermomonospora cellulosilytica]